MTMTTNLVVGIDVGKDELVVAGAGQHTSYANTPTGHPTLVAALQRQPVQLGVLEASGGCERALLQALWAASIPLCRVNPRQVRDFARATGQVAKTDQLDAHLLAAFGKAMAPTPQPRPSQQRQELAELQAYRQGLVEQLVGNKNRLQQATHPRIRSGLETLIATQQAEIT